VHCPDVVLVGGTGGAAPQFVFDAFGSMQTWDPPTSQLTYWSPFTLGHVQAPAGVPPVGVQLDPLMPEQGIAPVQPGATAPQYWLSVAGLMQAPLQTMSPEPTGHWQLPAWQLEPAMFAQTWAGPLEPQSPQLALLVCGSMHVGVPPTLQTIWPPGQTQLPPEQVDPDAKLVAQFTPA
jgi:hypothetical protein